MYQWDLLLMLITKKKRKKNTKILAFAKFLSKRVASTVLNIGYNIKLKMKMKLKSQDFLWDPFNDETKFKKVGKRGTKMKSSKK